MICELIPFYVTEVMSCDHWDWACQKHYTKKFFGMSRGDLYVLYETNMGYELTLRWHRDSEDTVRIMKPFEENLVGQQLALIEIIL